ncbi:GGDEF domain-containing protein [Aquisalimonas lutea]|uniref:GGDEF domain-containing protein n=1 Tax=Aquisalimonas lutea TaxID=1327750 RepID=UPI0025B5F96E|nr:GGDEF domain-containing protein [Aquisalimonas lutea]MDN3518714.1 GGDEF domain-containing protein [Aquisalimonas lutea]
MTNAPRASSNRYRIHPLFATFVDADSERAFQVQVAPATRRHLCVALAVWAGLLLVFAVPDYITLGSSAAFYGLLAMRVGTAALVGGYAVATILRPTLTHNFAAISVLEIVGMTGFFLIYFLRPEATAYSVGTTLIVIVGIYLLVPNLLSWSTLVTGYTIVGTLISVAAVAPAGAAQLVALCIILLLPAVTGFVIAYRLQALRRTQFALITEAEHTNATLRQEIARRQALEKQLEHRASTDPLTGLSNRRGYEELFDRELARARRQDTPLSLAVVDLDHFKAVNDTYGHTVGDQMLQNLAQEWTILLRGLDIAGRLGGEEFIIILPDTGLAEAIGVMERLRADTESYIPIPELPDVHITVTIGVTELRPDDTGIRDLIERADAALYRGKASGRNRVVTVDPYPETTQPEASSR